MKVIVLRTFRDAKHDLAMRLAGTQYNEPSKKRVQELEFSGFVKAIEPPIEKTSSKPATETKKKPPRKTTKKNK